MPTTVTPDALAHVAGQMLWAEYGRRLAAARARLSAAPAAAADPPQPIPFPIQSPHEQQTIERAIP
jgi:hypothetical protein